MNEVRVAFGEGRLLEAEALDSSGPVATQDDVSALEEMVVAKLQRSGAKYVLTDPRVINPPAPTSASDPNANAWSDSSSLFEFKTFTNGGADATYVQVGGASASPDEWSVNLATGRRTRLTSNPDWDEEGG